MVLTGDEHHYERFGRLDASGGLDEVRGIRHFVVGTGGNRLYALDDPQPSSEARFADGYGVLRFELGTGEYAWRFVGVPGVDFTDAGAEPCHRRPAISELPNAQIDVERSIGASRTGGGGVSGHGRAVLAPSGTQTGPRGPDRVVVDRVSGDALGVVGASRRPWQTGGHAAHVGARGRGVPGEGPGVPDRRLALARQHGVADDPAIRQRLARDHGQVEIMKWSGLGTLTSCLAGAHPGPEAGLFKVQWSDDSASWVGTFLTARAGTVYAGSSEIQRNIVGEMVLGLPKEPRPEDAGASWKAEQQRS